MLRCPGRRRVRAETIVSSARRPGFGQPAVTLELVRLQSFAALAYGTQSVPRVDKIGQISNRRLARPQLTTSRP